jgi:hypothetical protein
MINSKGGSAPNLYSVTVSRSVGRPGRRPGVRLGRLNPNHLLIGCLPVIRTRRALSVKVHPSRVGRGGHIEVIEGKHAACLEARRAQGHLSRAARSDQANQDGPRRVRRTPARRRGHPAGSPDRRCCAPSSRPGLGDAPRYLGEPDDLTYDRMLVADLTSLRFVEAGHGVLILGPVGVGKAHYADLRVTPMSVPMP